MLRCAGRIATISALCFSIGLHWIALQSLAWTTMVIDYSKHAPLCQAIAQTFDGAHPCSLCHVAAPKIDMICAPLANRIERPFVPFEYAMRNCFLSKLADSPPVPPPRSLLS
jgi:hypothetical protein